MIAIKRNVGQHNRQQTSTVTAKHTVAAKFAQMAGRFDAQVTVSRGGQSVSAVSIMGLMMLAAGPGTKISVSATGAEAAAALDAICALIDAKFEED